MRNYYVLLLLLTLSFLLLDAWKPLNSSSDFWAHAAVGRWIVEHRAIPRHTLFLWSSHSRWIAHSWLSEICCYALMRLGGPLGGAMLAATLSVATIFAAFTIALWPVVRSRSLPLTGAIVAAAAILAADARFVVRPDTVTLLLTAVVYAAVHTLRVRHGRRNAWIYALPLLFALWTNLHAGVLFGVAALWLAAVCDAAQFRDRLSRREIALAAVCTLCLAANPYGIGYLRVFVPLVGRSFSYIIEWKPAWQPPALSPAIVVGESVACAIAVATWLLAPQRRWAGLAWLVLSCAAFLDARRNMDVFALTSVAVYSQHYSAAAQSALVRRFSEHENTSSPLQLAHLAALAAAIVGLLVLVTQEVRKQAHESFLTATVSGLAWRQEDFLAHAHLGGARVLNTYDSSPYLEWRLAGRPKLFIDDLNAYPDSIVDQWTQMWSATPRGLALMRGYRIDCVVGERLDPGAAPPALYDYLFHSPDWRPIYLGADGPVFVRVKHAPTRG